MQRVPEETSRAVPRSSFERTPCEPSALPPGARNPDERSADAPDPVIDWPVKIDASTSSSSTIF